MTPVLFFFILKGEYMIQINAQSSIRIEEDKVYYFDPFRIKDENHDADYIFITHDHWDHFEKDSILKVGRDNTILIVPMNMKELVNDLPYEKIFVTPNNTYEIGNIKFKTTYSYNIDKDFHPKENENVGYIIDINNITYYISGDTDVINEMNDIDAEVWFIPIGGAYTMTYKEAADLINRVKPMTCFPTHYGDIVGDISYGNKFKELVKDTKVELLLK